MRERVRAAWRRVDQTAASLRPRDWRGWLELALVCGAICYVGTFLAIQLDGIFDPYVMEWDARANTLPAWRWHGTGLFRDDLLVDFAATQNPPLWRAVYWLGSLFVTPNTIAKWLPFPLFLVVVWQAWQFARRLGGRVAGATAIVLVAHCNFVWDRIVGGNARAFGFPLVFAFIRYAAQKRERAVLATLLLMALAYPSALVFCAPAWGLLLLARDERHRFAELDGRWLRFGVVGATALGLAAWFALHTDARIGHAITLDELEGLGQRTFSALWPLAEPRYPVQKTLAYSLFYPSGTPLLFASWPLRQNGAIALAVAAFLVGAAGRRLREVPLVIPALLVSSVVAFAVAQAVAYRLYFPERMLQFSWPPVLLLGLVAVGLRAFASFGARDAALLTAAVLLGTQLLTNGDGLARAIGLHDWHARETTVVKEIAKLGPDVVVAAPFDEANAVQYLAHRKVLFSAISNIPHHYPYAVELERRIRAWYLAYYARDWETVRRFARDEHVDYLVVDTGDFGPNAVQRAKYVEPWTALAQRLVRSGPAKGLVLAAPPPAAIVFHDGPTLLVDTHRL